MLFPRGRLTAEDRRCAGFGASIREDGTGVCCDTFLTVDTHAHTIACDVRTVKAMAKQSKNLSLDPDAVKRGEQYSKLHDINVILDVVLGRKPWVSEAAQLLTAVESGAAEGYIAAHTLTTIHYYVSK